MTFTDTPLPFDTPAEEPPRPRPRDSVSLAAPMPPRHHPALTHVCTWFDEAGACDDCGEVTS